MAKFEGNYSKKSMDAAFAKKVELSIQNSSQEIRQNIAELTQKWNTLNCQIDSSEVALSDKLALQQEADKIMEQIRSQTICFYEITKGRFI